MLKSALGDASQIDENNVLESKEGRREGLRPDKGTKPSTTKTSLTNVIKSLKVPFSTTVLLFLYISDES